MDINTSLPLARHTMEVREVRSLSAVDSCRFCSCRFVQHLEWKSRCWTSTYLFQVVYRIVGVHVCVVELVGTGARVVPSPSNLRELHKIPNGLFVGWDAPACGVSGDTYRLTVTELDSDLIVSAPKRFSSSANLLLHAVRIGHGIFKRARHHVRCHREFGAQNAE